MFLSVRLTSKIIAIPVVFCIVLISPLIRIRFIKLFAARIGHYSLNTEIILCGLDLNLDNDKKQKTWFYHPPGEPICNSQLMSMWKRTIPILPLSSIASETDKLLQRVINPHSAHATLKKTFEPGGDGRDRWGLLQKIKQCHLSFLPEEIASAQLLMEKLGIPRHAPFVCLLVRDPTYLSAHIPSGNWEYHDYRDADIKTYQLAAEYLAEQGYYVLRMGKVVKEPFVTGRSEVIDYASSALRCDLLDMYLAAHCEFFISTCTGLDSVARIFRRPFLVTNLGLPDFDIWHPWNIFIPKNILNIKENRLLTFQEMHELYPLLGKKQEIPNVMQQKELRFINNSAEELKAVVAEMVAFVQGKQIYSPEDEALQQHFWQIFPKYSMTHDLPNLPLAFNEKINMRLGTAFLKQHLSLLKTH